MFCVCMGWKMAVRVVIDGVGGKCWAEPLSAEANSGHGLRLTRPLQRRAHEALNHSQQVRLLSMYFFPEWPDLGPEQTRRQLVFTPDIKGVASTSGPMARKSASYIRASRRSIHTTSIPIRTNFPSCNPLPITIGRSGSKYLETRTWSIPPR